MTSLVTMAVMRWKENYRKFIEYKKEHDSLICVAKQYAKDPQLVSWVDNQCTRYKNNKLSVERTKLLNSAGFIWKASQEHLDRRCKEKKLNFIVYRKEHNGSTSVPFCYAKDPQLGRWVNKKRQKYKQTKNIC